MYVFDDAEPKKQKLATHVLTEQLASSQIVVSTQVMQELYVALTRGAAPIATPDIAERAVRDASAFVVVQIDVPMVLEAIGDVQRRSISFWDALIVRAAVSAGCDVLLSEDLNTGATIDGVSIQNPFA
ncbi:MAG: PIN domain-containing protein [Sandaracinaceae bacterium]|nr:PIN domain-containing protein [Sandaracinaceae bacterium]